MAQTATIEPSRAAGERQGIVKFVIRPVGVIGLGNKGHALAVNLVEDGYQVRVFDRNRERIMAMESTDAMEPGPF
jgi:UDP-N-acetylmuramoylalanine-D-glutamate ligase